MWHKSRSHQLPQRPSTKRRGTFTIESFTKCAPVLGQRIPVAFPGSSRPSSTVSTDSAQIRCLCSESGLRLLGGGWVTPGWGRGLLRRPLVRLTLCLYGLRLRAPRRLVLPHPVPIPGRDPLMLVPWQTPCPIPTHCHTVLASKSSRGLACPGHHVLSASSL